MSLSPFLWVPLAGLLLCSSSPIGAVPMTATNNQAQVPHPYPPNVTKRSPDYPGPGQMFVGTCYQPIDRTPAQVKQDIAIMKKAGFNVVRMGDLSWDSFEPAKDKFEFAWFDSVMDQMHAAGIRVVLDIPGSPAPIWLHRAYPGADIVNQEGDRVPPAERYMDNISDPHYVERVKIMTRQLLTRYAKHPAVIAIGYDNEIGNGFMSYSEADRLRFIQWLKKRYRTVKNLNTAWATQRWSRRLNSFNDVDLPLKNGPGPSERYVDLHRYWSDVTIQRLRELEAIRREIAPEKPTLSNLWDYAWRRGFDYLASYKDYVSFGAMGFYPGGAIDGSFQLMMTKGALKTPVWLNEFSAGGGGWYGDPGRSRMLAYVTLLNGAQGIMAWTFNSHSGGEEQALFGLVDHDGKPSWKVDEWAGLARAFKKLGNYGFPRYFEPEVAIAYSFESAMASAPNGPSNTTKQYYKGSYMDQVQGAFEAVFRRNLDAAVINPAHEDLGEYKLLIVPGQYMVDTATAKKIRAYVHDGGTVLMTGYSAKVNENSQWYETTLPGGLSDVFGIRTAAFYRNDSGVALEIDGKEVTTKATYYEILEPRTAKSIGRISNSYVSSDAPAMTVNTYGKGKAYYLATESTASSIQAVLSEVKASAGVPDGPQTPEGVYVREVNGRKLFINTNYGTVTFPLAGRWKGILSGKEFDGSVTIDAKDGDLLEATG